MSLPLRALFASHADSLRGGAERCLLETVLALDSDGRVLPTVVVPSEGELAQELRRSGLSVRIVGTPLWAPLETTAFDARTWAARVRKRAHAVARTTRYAAPWRRVIQAERPDVVISNTATIASPALAAASLGVPHVWWIHEFVTRDHRMSYALGERASQTLIGLLSAGVVVNSRAVGDHFSPPVPSSKISLIYPGVTVPEADVARPGSDRLHILMLGRQSESKGSSLAVRALARLPDLPGVSLRLVGWMPDRYGDYLTTLATQLGVVDRVTIINGTDDPFGEINSADVVLMCSDNEAFGRVTVEALKLGRPVIGARSGATPELISDEVDGLFFEADDVEGLALAVRRLADDRALLGRLGEQASAGKRDRFTIGEVVERTVRVLEDAARRPRQGGVGSLVNGQTKEPV